MKKLNAKGFSHWILPLAAVVVIAGVGTYVITKSKAASINYQCWITSAPSTIQKGYGLASSGTCKNIGTVTWTSSNTQPGTAILGPGLSKALLSYAHSPTSYTVKPGQSITFKYTIGTSSLVKGRTYTLENLIINGTGGPGTKTFTVI